MSVIVIRNTRTTELKTITKNKINPVSMIEVRHSSEKNKKYIISFTIPVKLDLLT